jgi:hypothetical protein
MGHVPIIKQKSPLMYVQLVGAPDNKTQCFPPFITSLGDVTKNYDLKIYVRPRSSVLSSEVNRPKNIEKQLLPLEDITIPRSQVKIVPLNQHIPGRMIDPDHQRRNWTTCL